jgi:hypothetical protein
MAAMKRTKKGSFRATATKSGQQMIIHYWTQYADASDNESHAEIAVSRRFETDRGEAVRCLAKGHYVVEATGENLRSDDPKAP